MLHYNTATECTGSPLLPTVLLQSKAVIVFPLNEFCVHCDATIEGKGRTISAHLSLRGFTAVRYDSYFGQMNRRVRNQCNTARVVAGPDEAKDWKSVTELRLYAILNCSSGKTKWRICLYFWSKILYSWSIKWEPLSPPFLSHFSRQNTAVITDFSTRTTDWPLRTCHSSIQTNSELNQLPLNLI